VDLEPEDDEVSMGGIAHIVKAVVSGRDCNLGLTFNRRGSSK
jgi:hypothetical protein